VIAMTRIAIIAAALALALTGCGSSPDTSTQQAWQACAGVEPWQVHSDCLRDQYRLQDAQQRDSEATAAILLMGGTAFLNGYHQGRPATTTCFTTGMMTQCTSP
jgi:F0F1-type ATP synthase membrane subunit c/vacuolar-type H+-ATPase subunit K